MKKFLKTILVILIVFITVNIFNGCMKQKEKESLNILLEEPKESDNEFINTIIEEYKKENKDTDIKIEISQDINESKKILKDNMFDLIFCSRNSMIEFSRKGLLKNIGSLYDSEKINSRFYNIVCSYGRYNNTYYGIGLMPYSLNILINENISKEFLKHNEILEVNNMVDIISRYNKQIPIILPKGTNISLVLGTFIANNLLRDNKLEENFSDDKLKYENITEIKDSFRIMNSIVKKLNDNEINLIERDEKAIDELKSGKFPLIFATTLGLKNISQDKNIKVISNILDNKYKISPAVVVDHNLCVFQDRKNDKQTNKFLDFICKDDIYIKLAKEGYISGNSKGATYIEGIQRDLMWIISLANENNIAFYLNLPSNMKKSILKEFNNIMNGKYDNQEWNRIIDKSF